MTTIRDYDPREGAAFQGDVAIIPVPSGITINTEDEIAPVDGRLILQAGEVTGHHHAIDLSRSRNFRPAVSSTSYADALSGATPELRRRLSGRAKAKAGTARLYRDTKTAEAMVRAGILARADLCVGVLRVEGGTVVVRHEEHDGIRLPTGDYYVGRQIESAGAEERRVED